MHILYVLSAVRLVSPLRAHPLLSGMRDEGDPKRMPPLQAACGRSDLSCFPELTCDFFILLVDFV